MSMDEFVSTLTDKQKEALMQALSKEEKPKQTESNQDNITEDFRVVKNNNNLKSDSRREPVSAQKNTWTDEGEHKNISTPDVQRTPRNRPPPKMKDVTCNKCNKIFKVNASVVYGEYHICDRCVSKR